jgi:hypothetical protein
MTLFASTQATFLRVEAIADDVLCLRDGPHRAIVEVGSLSFNLQGPAEQEAILASYAAFLNSLTFPIQILVRVLPIDVDRFLAEIEDRAREVLPEPLAALARDYCAFVRRLARHRTLLERRYYLVVPAPDLPRPGKRGFGLFGRPPSLRRDDDAIATQLAFRCEEVARQLGRCGLSVRRLSGDEIAELLYRCACDELARVQRLGQELGDYTTLVVRASAKA